MKKFELIGIDDFELNSSEIYNLIDALKKIDWKFKLKRNGSYWNIIIEKER